MALPGPNRSPESLSRISQGALLFSRSIHRKLAALAVLVVATLSAVIAAANGAQQRGRRGGVFASRPTGSADAPTYDGAFRFCRIRFRNAPDGDGHGWDVDYPRADVNLSLRLSQVTKTPVTLDVEGNPAHIVVRLTDPELFQCPFVMMTEPGGTYFSEQEAAQLRIYLLKGGFLWADDFWGSYAWQWWTNQIGKAFPQTEYPIVDLSKDHPIYHTFFDIDHVPQIPNIGLWLNAHITSERGADSAEPHARAILDRAGRVIVFMTHNTDFGDAYEEEAVSPDYFRHFSVQAYRIGINVLLYALTH
jgi:hypothetical protein